MKTKQIVDGKWVYANATEPLKVGDTVFFTCNGKGRGGHYAVTAVVTQVKRKTFAAQEASNSYAPGSKWNVSLDADSLFVMP
jgi:plastocyanin